jgi:hypothetical protein
VGTRSEPKDHLVQFYASDEDLIRATSRYFAEALVAGDTAVAIASPQHLRGFEAAMESNGIDVKAARSDGRWLTLDAADTLASFMVDGSPDPTLFDRHVGAFVRIAEHNGGLLHGYGEMVALLWADGNVAGALELEELWNALRRDVQFFLWCAYPSSIADDETNFEAFQRVCHTHSTTIGLSKIETTFDMTDTETQSFECALHSPSEARRFVRQSLQEWGLTQSVNDVLLVVSELVTNSVMHAQTGVTVSVARRSDVIHVEVEDGEPLLPLGAEATVKSLTGRGLVVVAEIASRWGSDLAGSGKVVWADIAR